MYGNSDEACIGNLYAYLTILSVRLELFKNKKRFLIAYIAMTDFFPSLLLFFSSHSLKKLHDLLSVLYFTSANNIYDFLATACSVLDTVKHFVVHLLFSSDREEHIISNTAFAFN